MLVKTFLIFLKPRVKNNGIVPETNKLFNAHDCSNTLQYKPDGTNNFGGLNFDITTHNVLHMLIKWYFTIIFSLVSVSYTSYVFYNSIQNKLK